MNMIEKVAKEIDKACNEANIDQSDWANKVAKVAILAMREPTDEMVLAGRKRTFAIHIYEDMINVALGVYKEAPEEQSSNGEEA